MSGLGAVKAKEWLRLVRIQMEKVVGVREYFYYSRGGCFIREAVRVFIREAVRVEVMWVEFDVPITHRFKSLRTHRLILGVVNASDLVGFELHQAAGDSLELHFQFIHC